MAGNGPAPKDPSKRRRRNAEPVPTTALQADDVKRGPDLPPGPWHGQTIQWWENWRVSPQAASFLATDWDVLLETALLHTMFWKGDQRVAGELRLRVAKFGATVEDRARLRMQATEEQPKEEKPVSRYERLKSVK